MKERGPSVVPPEEWKTAREELLVKEKEHTANLTDEGVLFRTKGEATALLPPDQFIGRFLQHGGGILDRYRPAQRAGGRRGRAGSGQHRRPRNAGPARPGDVGEDW